MRIRSIIISCLLIILPLIYSHTESIFPNEITSSLFVLLFSSCAFVSFIRYCYCTHHQRISISSIDVLFIVYFLYSTLILVTVSSETVDKYIFYKWGAVLSCYVMLRFYTWSKMTLLYGYTISGIVQAFIATSQKYGITSSRSMTFEITGSLNNPGPLGGYLAICTAVSVALLYYALKSKEYVKSCLLFIGCIILFYGLVLSDSRSALFALIMGIGYFSAQCSQRLIAALRKYKISFTIVIGIAAIICGTLLYKYRPASADARLLIWRVSANMVADSPFIGHGINSFSKEYMIYQSNYFKESPNSSFTQVADNVVYPFNEFLNQLIQKGLLGFMLVITLIYFALSAPNRSIDIIISKSGLLVLLAFSCFSYPTMVFPLLLFYPLFLGSIENKTVYSINIGNWGYKINMLLTSVLIILTIRDVIFINRISDALSKLYQDNNDIEESTYEKIKHNPNFNDYYMTWLFQQPTAIYNERVKDLYPSCEGYCILGKYLTEQGDYEQAEYFLNIASNMIPTRIRPQYYLWELYTQIKNVDKAVIIAEKILTMSLKIESTYTLRVKKRMKDYIISHNNAIVDIP